jgi:hypothetical protein
VIDQEFCTTGKIVVAVQAIIAVSLRTAKKSLPCAANITHGKHKKHGKDLEQRTAMKNSTAYSAVAHGKEHAHGKV